MKDQLAGRRWAALGRHGIRRRVVTVVLAGTLGLIGILGWIGSTASARVREEILEERTLVARSVALHIARLFDEELASLAALGLDLDFVSAPVQADHLLKAAYRRSRLFSSVFVVRLDGTPPLVEPASADLDAGMLAAASAAARTERPTIAPVRGGDRFALFLVPLGDAGHTVAVVGGTLPPDQPTIAHILGASAPVSARIELRDDRGTTAAFGGLARAASRSGSPLLTADAPVNQLGWTISIVQPEADALAALYAVRRTALFLSPVLLAVAVLLAWGSAASVVRPLELLTRAAEAIAGGDLEAPVPPAGTDEAGRLGRALDDMRIALKRSIEGIEAANAQLERGVAERTHELNRLYDELRAHDRLRGELLKKAISAQEDERKRVARELHDETSQTVNALLMELDAALARYPSEFTRAHLADTRALAARLLDGIHRLILDLRPSILDDLGLFSAIEWFARQHLVPLGIAVRFEASGGEVRLPRETELALFRAAQETITNIARHARADAVLIQCNAGESQFVIDIEDDGDGFDVAAVTTDPTSMRGLGLAGMRERASLVGGHIDIDSTLGAGTRVVIAVPLAEEATPHV